MPSSDTTRHFTLKSLLFHPEFRIGAVRVPANLGLRLALLWAVVLVLALVAAALA